MGRLYSKLREIVDRRGRCIAVISADENITFETIGLAVDRCAEALGAAGVRSGNHILASFGKPEFSLIALFAANKIGASLVFGSEADAAVIDRKIDYRACDRSNAAGQQPGTVVLEKTLWAGEAAHATVNNVIDSDGIQVIFGTSGSTGERKFVAISERNLQRRISSKSRLIDDNTRMLCTMGASTLVASEVHLATILGGGSVVLLPLKSDYIAHYVDLFFVTALFSTPLIYADLVTLNFVPKLYQTLDRVIMGGSIAPASLIEGVSEKVCGTIFLAYGNSEMGTVAWLQCHPGAYETGMSGQVFDDVEVEIVGEDGTALPAGDEGIVRIRRDNIIAERGYLNLSMVNDKAFVDDWFYPGDNGSIDGDGNLMIASREDDVINVGGNKFSFDLIENEIESQFECRCAALRMARPGAEDGIALVVSAEREMRARRILKQIEKRFPRLEITGVFQAGAIATTDTGKKDRLAVARLMTSEPNLFRKLD